MQLNASFRVEVPPPPDSEVSQDSIRKGPDSIDFLSLLLEEGVAVGKEINKLVLIIRYIYI